ncbi:MAG: hypothetical protein IKD04_00145 [Clostridia bacterium]|nr:hypothetical protein [Clostridia bacterium]
MVYTPPVKALRLWQIRAALLWVALLLACFALFSPSRLLFPILTALTAVFLTVILWYLPRFLRSCRISCQKNAIIIEQGVFVKKCQILSFNRLLFAQSLSTPLSRLLGLRVIILKGTRGRALIPELSKKASAEILSECEKR